MLGGQATTTYTIVSRLLLFWVSAGGVILTMTGGASNAVTAAVGVPLLYAVFTKVLDFLAKWELKGRRYSGDYIIWTENEDGSQLRAQDGDVDTLVDLDNSGIQVASIEKTVRLKDSNPCSLGLDLTAGAIAVDVASAIVGQGGAPYLGLAFILHSVVLGGVITLVWMNHHARPHEHWWIKISASFAIAAGALAMATSFLALDPRVVSQILSVL